MNNNNGQWNEMNNGNSNEMKIMKMKMIIMK
jgi:hypothetical protein